MKRLGSSLAIALLIALLTPAVSVAAVPTNDQYRDATAIASLPFTTPIDLSEATDDPQYPPCEAVSHGRIWFTYTPAVDQVIKASVGGDPSVEIALWTIEHGGPNGIQLSMCAAASRRDLLTTLIGGQDYAISVGQWTSDPPFVGTLNVEVVPPPANDDFADAATIVEGNTTVSQEEIVGASVETGEATPSCDPGAGDLGRTLWYTFSVATPARATLDAQGPTVALYSGSSVGSLTELACLNAFVSVDLAPGTYYIQANFWSGSFGLDLVTPPANDDFANATSIASTPFTESGIDFTFATTETDEPGSCSGGYEATAWWSYTATAEGVLSVNGYGLPVGVWRGASLGSLTALGCASYQQAAIPVDTGDVVLLQLAGPMTAGPFGISVDFAAAPANDDFASSSDIETIPFDSTVNLAATSFETGEPLPSCYQTPVSTVWYRLTGTGESTSFSFEPSWLGASVAAYTGSSVDALTEIGCASSWASPVFTIKPNSGANVWIQVGLSPYASGTNPTLHVFATPDPIVDFTPGVSNPSVFTDLPFYDNTNDPGGAAHTSMWDFGDGTTSSESNPSHRYSTDGDYDVTLSVLTTDGRTGSVTKTVMVRTHDVAITKLMVPTSARAGQTKTITVGVANKRYPETGTVQLLAIRPGGFWEFVGERAGVALAVRAGGQTTDVSFKYKFTSADATAGKVTFRAIVLMDGPAFDVAPADNDLSAPPTRVSN